MTTMNGTDRVVIDHPIGNGGRLVVNLASAEIRLAAADGDRVVVRTPDGRSLSDRIVVETLDDELSIREAEPSGISFGRGRRTVQVEIDVPVQAAVEIATASGWLDAIGLRGEQRYRTTSGELRLRDVAGDIGLNSVSGDAEIDLAGPSELALKMVSGDLVIRGGQIDELRAATTSGDLRIDSPLAPKVEHRIETLSGDVRLLSTTGMRVEARTISGDLTTELPHRSEGRMGRRTLIVGDGSVGLIFRSVSGDLRIEDGSRLPVAPVPPVPPIAPVPPAPPAFPSSVDLGDVELPDLDPGDSDDDRSAPAAEPDPFETERMTILRALERGELDVATAMDRLAALDDGPKPDPEHRR